MSRGKGGRSNLKLDPYSFRSLKDFIQAAVDALRESTGSYSLRQLSEDAGLSVGLLPLVLGGKRRLTPKTLEKVMACLSLAEHEKKYLRSLRLFQNETDAPSKSQGLKQLERSTKYRQKSKAEFATFRYLSHWFLPAIREMVGLKDFVPEPEYIQKRLWRKISIQDIRSAWEFLVQHRFVVQNSAGRWSFEGVGMIRCEDQVLRLAMMAYYKQMYEVSVESFDQLNREQRDHQGFLIAMDTATKQKAQEMIQETLQKIEEMAKTSTQRDDVCFLGTMIFPLTKTSHESE